MSNVVAFPSPKKVLFAQYAITEPGRPLPLKLRTAQKAVDFLRLGFQTQVESVINDFLGQAAIDEISYEPAPDARHAAPGQVATDVFVTTRRLSQLPGLREGIAEHWEDDRIPFFQRYIDVITGGAVQITERELYVCVGHLIMPQDNLPTPPPRKIA